VFNPLEVPTRLQEAVFSTYFLLQMGLTKEVGDVWQIEKKQITFENQVVYYSLVSE